MTFVTVTESRPGAVADATFVNGDFTSIKSAVNGGLENANFAPNAAISVSKIAPGTNGEYLTNSTGEGGNLWGAAPTPDSIPAGFMMMYAGGTVPTGWLLCDGSSYTTAGKAGLYAVIGYTYGGSGPDFNVPDLRGRAGAGLGTNADVNALADNDGIALASRTPKIVHSHTHADPQYNGVDSPNRTAILGTPSSTETVVNNYFVVNWIIKE